MDERNLQAVLLARDWTQSDMARAAGVSRQAVSLWFKAPTDLRVSHLIALSRECQASLDALAAPMPDDPEAVAELLWDGLYSDLLRFASAIVRLEDKALARLAEVYGLYRSERIAGAEVWRRYPAFRNRIRPSRREELDQLWRWETGRA